MSIGTYVVRYDLDHGYSLDRGSKWIVPDIAVSERPNFDAFFADEKLAKLVGKRVYCRCEIIEALDEARPRVVKAYLFAR